MNEGENNEVKLTFMEFGDEQFLKITNINNIPPFFMSIVSDSDHWMFISSNGGLSAGRKNAEFALFPYTTDDKITELADITGSKSIFQISTDSKKIVWEPFSFRNDPNLKTENNIYKSIYGNKIAFEEILLGLNITFFYSWAFSEQFGFVKTANLINHSGQNYEICLLDGIQNIMPCGVSSDLQRASSNLVDAYKRNELHTDSGLGIFALSAIIVDKAEPSEALKANIVWSNGLKDVTYLLSSKQLNNFRKGKTVTLETDIKGEKGAYFISKNITLKSNSSTTWHIVADVNKNHSQVFKTIHVLQTCAGLTQNIREDIRKGTEKLINLVANADGIQYTNDPLQDCRNYSNVLFNIMRGGIFDKGYDIDKNDFQKYVKKANHSLKERHSEFFKKLEESCDYTELKKQAIATEDADLIRLTLEYLPLIFSRRHGDPSRPWNKFSINLKNDATGEKILDYEGNWRDIFQNWEALTYSFPEYIDSMICKFVNASTFDGYNPYRVTKDGFDWEVIEPDDPWAYIGYWGDHQIIYLQKFLELIEKFKPGSLQDYFDKDWFVYAAVPYVIKPYEDIVRNPKDTIIFDHHWDGRIRENKEKLGADGALLISNENNIYRVNLLEKLLATLLAKMSNFIPEGGIWLNTQRPEWNDANNALVGNGVSMVTLYYMRRFLVFFQEILDKSSLENVKLSNELIAFYHSVRQTLETNTQLLSRKISDIDRKHILDNLGKAASNYRAQIYKFGFLGKKRSASIKGVKDFVSLSITFIEHSIQANQRKDGLFHAYNIMNYTESGVSIGYLNEMLEGQVAILSSGFLPSAKVLEVLNTLKQSALFREDQYSYILYPNKSLPGFLNKNIIPKQKALSSKLIEYCVVNNNRSIVEKDVNGQLHFNGNFKNANDLILALDQQDDINLKKLVENEKEMLLEIFEEEFNHKAFTGRSGTFYGYEGLGSIYWHMVSKLLLAAQECCLKAIHDGENKELIGKLLDHYYEIKAGIGVHKSPSLYGAFPTDPYSHTPMHRGAQQPGMTGQVKEDILCRIGELGIIIKDGILMFSPSLLQKSEFLTVPKSVSLLYSDNSVKETSLTIDQLVFTYCQVPVIYEISDKMSITIFYTKGKEKSDEGCHLNQEDSFSVFSRDGKIKKIKVCIDKSNLK